jgi:hypothetical protein
MKPDDGPGNAISASCSFRLCSDNAGIADDWHASCLPRARVDVPCLAATPVWRGRCCAATGENQPTTR